MRIAVLADIHGNHLALQAVRADLACRAVDRVVNLGDCVSGPLWPAETADALMALGWPTVRGNHDRWVSSLAPSAMGATDAFTHARLDARQRAWLSDLPPTLRLDGGIVGIHGTPSDDNAYLLEEVEGGRLVEASAGAVQARLGPLDARILLCAHSHRPAVVQLPGGPLVVNPGSVGCPAYSDTTEPAHRSEARAPHARYAILTVDEADIDEVGIAVDLCAVAYDWQVAADAAAANGRPDWAHALRTGFMPQG